MQKRIFAEFDSTDMADVAVRRLKGLFGELGSVTVNSYFHDQLKGKEIDNTFPFPMINSVIDAFNGFWGARPGKERRYEPAENEAVVLSFGIDEDNAHRASNLVTAMGGRNIRVY